MCVTPQPVTSHIKETANIANDDLALLGTETATNVTFSSIRIRPSVTHMLNTVYGLAVREARNVHSVVVYTFLASPSNIPAFIHSYTPYHCTAVLGGGL